LVTALAFSSRDRVIIEVRNMILTGQLKPNQRLVEADLAQHLGISRTPIREAFRELTQIGLLVSVYHKGVRVANIDIETIRNAYDARADLESFAAELAAQRATDVELAQLVDLNDQLRQPNSGIAVFAVLNDEFHQILNQATRNQILVETINSLRARVRAIRMVFHYHPALIRESVRQHDEILAALADRAPQRARDAMRRHVRSGITELIERDAHVATSAGP